MADVELVIKISEKVYNALTHTEFDANLVVDEMRKSIQNGTPLPKGHGRLIDADSLKEAEQKWSCDYEHDGFSHIVEIRDIDEEPTIIEADTESEDKE